MKAERVAFIATTMASLTVYIFTGAPGLGLVDSGELTTAAWSLGIAHPTGYPLYTLLGRLWLALDLANPARAMVLFSAVCGAIAGGVLSISAAALLRRGRQWPEYFLGGVASLLGLAFAFSATAWNSVSFAEVYPLTSLLAALLLYSFVKFQSAPPAERQRMMFATLFFLWGLSFGNHFTVLWFAPVVAVLAVSAVRTSLARAKTLGVGLTLAALGASVNLYLPVRSAAEPLLDWSNPQSFDGLLRHLTGWQYQVWMFKGGWSAFFQKFAACLASVPADFGVLLAVFAILGVASSLRPGRKMVLVALGVWLLGVSYNLNYEIPDISTYFAPLYGALFLVACEGVAFLARLFESKLSSASVARAVILVLAAAAPLSAVALKPEGVVQTRSTFARDLAAELLRTLPDSALVLQDNWDIQSPVMYLQKVEKLRPDVVMLDLNLMQRPWYIDQERRAHPDVFAGCDDAIRVFKQAVAPFERDQPYDGPAIENAYVALHNGMIARQLQRRPVYLRGAREIGHPGVGAPFQASAGAYFARLSTQPLVLNEPLLDPDSIVKGIPRIETREHWLLNTLAVACVARGRVAVTAGDRGLAHKAARAAARFAPELPAVTNFKAQLDALPAAGTP